MNLTRKDAENLITDDGTADLPLLSRYMQELPHLWNLSRLVSFLVSEKLMADSQDGGWRDEKAVNAIAFSAWLNEQARLRGSDVSSAA